MDVGFKEKRPPHPRNNANLFEILTFGWTLNLFKTGKKRDLEVNDLYTTLDTHASAILGNQLEKKWKMELIRARKTKKKPSLRRALIQMFGPAFLLYGIFRTITEIFLSAYQPFFLGRVIAQFDPDTPSDKSSHLGIFYGICLLVTTMMKIFSFTAYDMLITHLGMKMRVAMCYLIYNKALRLSKTAIGETTVGQVVNLLSNDVNRFDIAITLVLYILIGPLETIVVTYFLWQEIGVSALFGIGVLLMLIPLQENI
uniref:Multidrug resistance-associated protein 4 n=1 Tax=Sipha flava TaxID=143950 RepID=A0A2S2QB40_9HEMI